MGVVVRMHPSRRQFGSPDIWPWGSLRPLEVKKMVRVQGRRWSRRHRSFSYSYSYTETNTGRNPCMFCPRHASRYPSGSHCPADLRRSSRFPGTVTRTSSPGGYRAPWTVCLEAKDAAKTLRRVRPECRSVGRVRPPLDHHAAFCRACAILGVRLILAATGVSEGRGRILVHRFD